MQNKLTIGYEAKRITHNQTGLGNYGRTLVTMLAQYAPDNSYLLYTPDKGRDNLRSRLDGIDHIKFCYPIKPKRGLGRDLWRTIGVVKELPQELSLFHGLSGELPLGLKRVGVRSIVTIHDLIFLRFPQYYKPIDRLIYTIKFRHACKCADRIIAISEATKRDIVHFFGIDEAKIDVVYQGCDESFKQKIDKACLCDVREKHRLPEHYILSVGSIEERKNLKLIVEAVAQMPTPIHIVAVGKRTPYTAEVEQYAQNVGLGDYLHIYNNIPFADLPAIYQCADLFIYPSRYEGFGIPMIEAACSGIPSIGATGSCLEEAGGEYALYVDPDDAKGLAWQIKRVLEDVDLREQMVSAGKNHVKQFETENIVSNILTVYSKVLQ